MIEPAEVLTPSAEVKETPVIYEHPLNERLRTFLRVEFLYQQLIFQIEQPSSWSSRAAVTNMLDIIAILSRGDSRSEVLKELERQLYLFERYQNLPHIDQGRLQSVLRNLQNLRRDLIAIGPQYLVETRESEFLNAIKHRSAIPGGTCEFDLPDYSHWLRKPYGERVADIGQWTAAIRPLCDSVAELLWLMRESGDTSQQVAVNGVFQHSFGRGTSVSLLRVSLPPRTLVYPEISASHHRFTVRFMHWNDVAKRAVQATKDTRFELRLC